MCECDRPLLSDETCLRCGRTLILIREPAIRPVRPETAWNPARVARALQAFAFFRGRAPMEADWTQRMDDWPPLDTVVRMFGSVEAASRAAGLQRSQPHVDL
jgi:hypothetical protein